MFSWLKNGIMSNNPDLALKLFDTIAVSTGNNNNNIIEQKLINDILKECKSRQEILNKVIEICGVPKTPKQRYIYAKAYLWSNKKYRKKAIYYTELYLSNQLYDDIYLHRFRYYDQPLEERKNEHISDLYLDLAKVYEKMYIFDKAILNSEIAIELVPYCPLAYRTKVSCLIKDNKIDEAINYLKDVKKSKYYTKSDKYAPDTLWFMNTIDELLNNCKIKKENNYIYKPRRKEINYE